MKEKRTRRLDGVKEELNEDEAKVGCCSIQCHSSTLNLYQAESIHSEGFSTKDDAAGQQYEDSDAVQHPAASVAAKSSPQHSNNRNLAHKPSRNPKNNRTGRNQYTKDRDNPTSRHVSASPALRNKDFSPPSTKASDTLGGSGDGNTSSSHVEVAPYHGRNAKAKNQRSNLNDMRKRVAGMLEFISRVQVDMAQERPSSTASSELRNINRNAMAMMAASLANVNGDQSSNEDNNNNDNNGSGGGSNGGDDGSAAGKTKYELSSHVTTEKPFAQLSSLEMMDVLTRNLVLWQKTFGKIGDK